MSIIFNYLKYHSIKSLDNFAKTWFQRLGSIWEKLQKETLRLRFGSILLIWYIYWLINWLCNRFGILEVSLAFVQCGKDIAEVLMPLCTSTIHYLFNFLIYVTNQYFFLTFLTFLRINFHWIRFVFYSINISLFKDWYYMLFNDELYIILM
jgi:hypothetical protein